MSFLCQNQGVDKVLGYGHRGLWALILCAHIGFISHRGCMFL